MEKPKYVAFFDLDKTIIPFDSGSKLAWNAYKNGVMRTRDLFEGLFLALLYKMDLKDNLQIVEDMVAWLKGVSEHRIEDLSNQLVKKRLLGSIRPMIIKEIERHRKLGAEIVLLSAALPYICKPMAKHLKIKRVISSHLEVIAGKFTGKPLGHLCFGIEKKHKAIDFCKQHNFDISEAYYYGDSFSDSDVLESVGNPICVVPEKKLLKRAMQRKWTIML